MPLPGKRDKTFHSLPSFTKWLLLTFQVIYLIEIEKSVLGFVGLYDMKPGKSMKLSITIFDPEKLGRGYGTEALGLLLGYMRKRGLTKEVIAEVSNTNEQSLSFFAKAGFEVFERRDDRIMLAKKLSSRVAS